MSPEQLISEIRSYCQAHANEDNVKKYSRYFKNEYIAYGLTQTEIQDKVKELLSRAEITLSLIIDAAPELIHSLRYEEPSFALLLLNGREKQFTKETFQKIENWYSYGISNWAHADTLGMMILPGFLLKHIVSLDEFKPWITSSHKFQRRCVPVTLIKILKNNKTADFTTYFAFIEPLMTDKEREVHQGVGWFLREAWKIQPSPTEQFLLRWKDRAPRLIIQYATEKMTPKNKNRFKRLKNG
jgi:3-methyladenine DNA glycosylase AlkD